MALDEQEVDAEVAEQERGAEARGPAADDEHVDGEVAGEGAAGHRCYALAGRETSGEKSGEPTA